MWSYYGSKTNVIKNYPKPIFDKIIEPFAGTAKYSLLYFEKEVTLIDKYKVIVDIWKYLQQCSQKDILSLPRLKLGENLNNFKSLSIDERNLLGFIVAKGVSKPQMKATKLATCDRQNHINFSLTKISNQLHKIKHWEIINSSYELIDNQKCTWFIDPPYQFGGQYYAESSKNINFDNLSSWCTDREGQVIVCENMKAKWLPFNNLSMQHGTKGWQSEAIWTNYHTHYNNIQQQLF